MIFNSPLITSATRILGLLCTILSILWLVIARPVIVFDSVHPHSVDAISLKKHVKTITEDYFPRNSQHPEILSKLASYLFDEFQKNTSNVTFQEFVVDGENYKNVIAKFGPETKDVIVIGAHYDSYAELPGADDNASGVAGLIELSRLLKHTKLDMQVQLVAYSLEEPPWFGSENMGSYIHAESLHRTDISVDLMISLEMIGFFSADENSQEYPVPLLRLFYPDTGNFIAVVDQIRSGKSVHLKSAINTNTSLEAFSINAPNFVNGVDFSDHRNYWKFNYPAAMITNTAFYRNRAYHTDKDTYETLNYHKMADVIYGVFCYLRDMSEHAVELQPDEKETEL